jgi:hypothetical protein
LELTIEKLYEMETKKLKYLLGLVVVLIGCTQEYGPFEYAPSINFSYTGINVNENVVEPTVFNLFLHQSSFSFGVIPDKLDVSISGIKIDATGFEKAVYGVDYLLTPIPEIRDSILVWTFNQNDIKDTVRFELLPIHNKGSIENKRFMIKIDQISEGIAMGGQSSVTIGINNVDASIEGYSLTAAPISLICPNTNVGTVSNTSVVFTLTANGLTRDITVARTPHFKFSLTNDSNDAKDMMVIPIELLNESGQIPVYVFFAPASTGLKTGALFIRSYGARDARVSLRGTGI